MNERFAGRGSLLRVGLTSTGLVSLVVGSLHPLGLSNMSRAVLLLVGYVLLVGALWIPPRRLKAPAWIAGWFVIYGGVSAAFAAENASPGVHARAFAYASLITSVAAAAAIGGAAIVARHGGFSPRHPLHADLERVERAGRVLVIAGFLGLIGALVRFAIVELPTDDLWTSMKSFWHGNSYLLLLANAAVPGFGLWLSAAVRRERRQKSLLTLGMLIAVYLGASATTGQRGFAIEVALVLVSVLMSVGRIRAPQLAGVLVLGVVLAGVTQAARNEIHETGTVKPHQLISRVAPDRWRTLYGSQIASFDWTWDVAIHRRELKIPNTFLYLALKPVPRQLLPNKIEGFGAEFTKRLYPRAYSDKISFATPLTAETDYDFGPVGVPIVFLLFGLAAGAAELLLVRRAPEVLAPVWAASVLWSGFMLLRGDLANATTFSAGLVVPLAFVSLILGFRPVPRARRLVIDALQVPAKFSGVGREVLAMGKELAGAPPDVLLEVRCAEDVLPLLAEAFPPTTYFRVPLRRSRPRALRLAYQQVLAPLLDPRSSVLLCPGDQAPVWGRARIVLVVYDVRRLTHPETSSSLERIFYRLLVPWGIRRAARIVTASRFSASEIRRLSGNDLVIDVVAHHKPPQRTSRRPVRRSFLLSVGALRPYKGAHTVIDALARFDAAERPEVVFVGEGDGLELRLKERAERAGVAGSVRFLGWVDDDVLAELYRTCLATIQASEYEGYGLPVAESLSHGAPTIASDIPAHREVAEGAALYFTPADPESLAHAIKHLLGSDSLRVELTSQALARSQELIRITPTWRDVIVVSASMVGLD